MAIKMGNKKTSLRQQEEEPLKGTRLERELILICMTLGRAIINHYFYNRVQVVLTGHKWKI